MKRVLIIEDDVVVSSIYRRKYELSGFDVENAHDGVSGLAKIAEFRPDIVQLDLQLPKMNGIDLIKEVRAKPEFKNLPILVLSSFYKHDMVKDAWKAGATKCVTKIECTPVLALEIIQQMLAEGHQTPAGAVEQRPAPPPPSQPQGGYGYPVGYPVQQPGGYPPSGGYAPSPYPQQPAPPAYPQQYPPSYPNPYPQAPVGYPGYPPSYPSQGGGGYAPQSPAPEPAAPPQAYLGYPGAGTQEPPVQEAKSAPVIQTASPKALVSQNTPPSMDIRQEFLSRVPTIQTNLRDRANNLIRAKGVAAQLPQLREFHEACHAVASLAATTGFVRVSHLAEALELLLKELHSKPARVTPSSLRTIAHAADTLILLCQEAQDGTEGVPQSGMILAVDDEPISRKVLANALSKASLKTISLDDSGLALRVLTENQFDLIFLDGDMPGMNGFELCKHIRNMPSNKATPVVFVTSLNDFDTRAQSSLAGGNDLIAKPFLMIELAVKALTYLMKPRGQVPPQSKPQGLGPGIVTPAPLAAPGAPALPPPKQP